MKVGRDTRFFVAEMGASHVGEITRLTTIAPPDIAVVLKVGCAHLGEFGSVERIAQAKSEIVQGLVPDGLAVLNADDAHVAAMAPLAPQGHVFWFGMAGDDAEASAGHAASGKSDALFASDVRTDDGDRPSFTLERADGGTAHVQLAIRGHAQRDERPRRGERRPPAGRAAAVDRRDAVASVPHQPAPHGGVHGPARRDVFHADR